MQVRSRTAFLMILFWQSLVASAAGQSPSDSGAAGRSPVLVNALDSLQIQRFLLRQQLIDAVLEGVLRDSTTPGLSFSRTSRVRIPLPSYSDSTTGPPPAIPDPVDEESAYRAGRTPILDFGDAVRGVRSLADRRGKKSRRRRVQDLPPLSPDEVHVLTVLWEKGSATGPQIYSALAGKVNLTAEMMWRALRRLARKGYLGEKIVSPQLLFTIQTPLFSVPIEMSPKNRRNREYLYWPLVPERDLLQYFLAQKYLQGEKRGANGVPADQLDRMIEILVRARAARRP